MADTFFDLDCSLNRSDNPSPDDQDYRDSGEEEYDLFNDETFGALGDPSSVDDWEQQHEQLAEIEENHKKKEQIENSLCQLVMEEDDYPSQFENISKYIELDLNEMCKLISYQPSGKKGPTNKTGAPATQNKIQQPTINANTKNMRPPQASVLGQQCTSFPTNIRTVEELERSLLKSRAGQPLNQPKVTPPPPQPYHGGGIFQGHPPLPTGRLPPGLHHPMGLPPQIRPPIHHPNLPPGLIGVVPPPQFLRGHLGGVPPHPPPGLVYPGNSQYPMNHQYNFPPIPRNPNMPHIQQHNMNHHPQKNSIDTNSNIYRLKHELNEVRDEYAGLMTNREKQWLLNIQLLQLNTGTPYFDDYYYTVFKERKAKTDKENQPLMDRNHRYQHNNRQHGHHRNNDMQENANQLTPRVYTPLQFENSLGKLQCGSVTAPRKIIDMDVVTLDKDAENPTTPRDTRKTKQLLLELEALYSLLLKAEDLKNPLAISNTEKLRQLKQKQRLRELEAAPTPEQKQEILKLLQKESIPIVENQQDYLTKIIGGFLQDDKFNSFLNIRKGKMLLLRILPLLTMEAFSTQLSELWMKVLLSIPIIGRRDTAGDNILPRLHPYFKRYIQTSKIGDIIDIVTSLIEVTKPENNRCTPLSHQGRAPLNFVVTNKFGVSSLVTMLVRSEYLISSGNMTDKQQNDWSNFVISLSEACSASNNVAKPVELISAQTFNKHCVRIPNLTPEKKAVLEECIVDNN